MPGSLFGTPLASTVRIRILNSKVQSDQNVSVNAAGDSQQLVVCLCGWCGLCVFGDSLTNENMRSHKFNGSSTST